MPYTEEGYMKLGRNLARTFLDYYKLTNYITVKPTSGEFFSIYNKSVGKKSVYYADCIPGLC